MLKVPVGCAGPLEEREDVGGALCQGAAKLADLDERGGNPTGNRGDHGLHHGVGLLLVRFAVGRDHALIDTPPRFDLDMLLDRVHRVQSDLLLVSEQARAGVQGAARLVGRIALHAATIEQVLLDAAADIQGITRDADHGEGSHHGDELIALEL